ncbi:MAG: outer membrane protein [bacterium]
MKIRNAVLSASVSAAALLAAQGVMAGGLKDLDDPVPMATSWHGFYLGAHIGAGEADVQGVYDPNDESSEVDFGRIDLSGVLGGVHVGYNWDFGHWIAGVEADFSAMDWSGVAHSPSSSEEAEGEFDALASIRGRLGVPVGEDRTGFLYATGGAAFPSAELSVCDEGCATTDEKTELDLDDVGGVVGAGFEWAATDSVRVRFETLYYLFDDDDNYDSNDWNATSTGEGIGLDDAWTVRLGATWYLNGTE